MSKKVITDLEYNILDKKIDHQISDIRAYTDSVIGSIENADWNTNDETASSYVKNRTHYEATLLQEVVPETIITSTSNTSNMYHVRFLYQTNGITGYDHFIAGNEYLIIIDGVEYREVASDGNTIGIADDGSYTMPVVFCGAHYMANSTYVCTLEANTSYTVSVYHTSSSIKQLDEKYIPDTIARTNNIVKDWNQNDATAADYVKNRTHWIDDDGTIHKLDSQFLPTTSWNDLADRPITNISEIVTLIDNETITLNTVTGVAIGPIQNLVLIPDVQYTVIVDEKDYNVGSILIEEDGMSVVGLLLEGEPGIATRSITYWLNSENTDFQCVYQDTTGSSGNSIVLTVIGPRPKTVIDPEYLPTTSWNDLADKPFNVELEATTIVPYGVYDFTLVNNRYGITFDIAPSWLSDWRILYEILFDGKFYYMYPGDVKPFGDYGFGNTHMYEAENTENGYPFTVINAAPNKLGVYAAEPGEHTFQFKQIESMKTHGVPAIYLKDNIATFVVDEKYDGSLEVTCDKTGFDCLHRIHDDSLIGRIKYTNHQNRTIIMTFPTIAYGDSYGNVVDINFKNANIENLGIVNISMNVITSEITMNITEPSEETS